MQNPIYKLKEPQTLSKKLPKELIQKALDNLVVGLEVMINADFYEDQADEDGYLVGGCSFYVTILDIKNEKIIGITKWNCFHKIFDKDAILEFEKKNIHHIQGNTNWRIKNQYFTISKDITVYKNRIDLISFNLRDNCLLDSGIYCYSVKEAILRTSDYNYEYIPLFKLVEIEPQIINILNDGKFHFIYLRQNGKFRGLSEEEIIKEYQDFTHYGLTEEADNYSVYDEDEL